MWIRNRQRLKTADSLSFNLLSANSGYTVAENINNTKSYMEKKLSRSTAHLYLFFISIIIITMLTCGCSHLKEASQVRSLFSDANDFFSKGNYNASLGKYKQIIEKYPAVGDKALFEMGIIYGYFGNDQKDYQKSIECFQKLIKDYPESNYRKDSEMMIFHINNVKMKDMTLSVKQTLIETLQQEIKNRGNEISALQEKIELLEQKIFSKENEIAALQKEIFALQTGPADKVLIEKKERRLTLLSKGKVLKTYKIALGGNPEGPKERQGDSKTPEGTYFIESRNKNSKYHISLRISYPNENDKKRAKELGVSPGGDIMIHGIKNGFSQTGMSHAEVDWTKGCIAVTDEEIEEIDKLVPDGTVVEIRP